MIQLIDQKELQQLKSFNTKPLCISMYVPFVEAVNPANPNTIAIKNSIKSAKKLLRYHGVTDLESQALLAPMKELLSEHSAWQQNHADLALFIHQSWAVHYELPRSSVNQQLAVQQGFDLEQLQAIIQRNTAYYVLALGHKNVQLYQGDNYNLQPVPLAGLPANMKEALRIDEYPQSRETHSIAPASMGKGSEAYHSQYNVSQVDKDMLAKYFKLIDTQLHNLLKAAGIPLVIASAKYLQPIYRRVNTYPGLVSQAINGNVARVTIKELRQKALKALADNATNTQRA